MVEAGRDICRLSCPNPWQGHLKQVAHTQMKVGTQGMSGEKRIPFPEWVMPSVMLQYFSCIFAVAVQFQSVLTLISNNYVSGSCDHSN